MMYVSKHLNIGKYQYSRKVAKDPITGQTKDMNKKYMLKPLAVMLASLLVSAPSMSATQQTVASSAVMLQGFHWNSWNTGGGWYANLQGKAADMKDLGVTHVWFPPPSDAASNEGYLPRQLNLLTSKYGDEAALTGAISALTSQGIKSIADIVVNHRVGSTNWADFTNPTWSCYAVTSNDEWTGHCGAADTGDSYGAARDIDHTQQFVQNDLKTWIGTRLKNVGFSGVRFDYSKGYSAAYAKTYQDSMAGADFCVGEVWTDLNYANVDAHRQLLMNYIDGTAGTCAAFDFTTKGLLNDALANNNYYRLKDSAGKPAGAIGWWPMKAVTFVDNHDTGPSESCSVGQNHWPVPCTKVMEGYAYILTHPGIPSVYYSHVYDWNLRAAIKSLIGIRKTAGITSTSAVTIDSAVSGLYAATITGTNGQVKMKIGPNSWTPTGSWTLAASGTNYAVWTSGVVADTTAPTVPSGLSKGTVTANAATINWTASTDAVGVTGYKVLRNGTQVGTSTSTSFTNTGLSSATSYSYTVQAYDAAGNTSAASSALSVTTAAAADTTAPTVPTSVAASNVASTSLNLAWTASTDAVRVTGYKVFRNGTQIGTSSTNSYAVTGLTASTAYSFTVQAYDAAGNNSAASTALSVTTAAGTACNVNVTFSIANANTVWGQSLYAVGNQTNLGTWTPASGFKLKIQGRGANATWSGTTTVPANAAVQYKYVKWNGTTAAWERNQTTTSGNREFASGATCGATITRADGSFKF